MLILALPAGFEQMLAEVGQDVAGQLANGSDKVIGVMVESHLLGGRQDMVPGTPLVYGQSITDGCIDWDASVAVLERLAHAVRERRRVALTSGKYGRFAASRRGRRFAAQQGGRRRIAGLPNPRIR